jgi:hypothetical protein
LFAKFSFADDKVIFSNFKDLNECVGSFKNFSEYKTNFKKCLDSKDINISKDDLNFLSQDKIKKTAYKNINDLPKLIKKAPNYIYAVDTHLRSLPLDILSQSEKNRVLLNSYNNFNPKLFITSKSESSDLNKAIMGFGTIFAINEIINADDTKTVSLSTSVSSIAENSSSAITITATLSAAVSGATTVNLSTSGTATSGTDYTAVASSITIPGGSRTASTTFTLIDDSISDVDETVIISISSLTGQDVSIGTSATVTITDNESVPSISLSSSTSSIAENSGSSITLTATSSIISSSDVEVSLSASGTATSGTDYGAISSITIAAGSTTATATFTPTDDNFYDGANETAIFDISSVSGGSATENGTQQVTLTITDNETAPTVTLSTGGSSIAENTSSIVTITATLSGATYEDTTVNFTVSGTSTLNDDYTISTPITITAGSTSGTASISIVNDLVYEGNETIILDIASVSGGGVTENGTQQETITITEDDSAPTLSLASSSSSLDENGSAITLTGTLSNPTHQTVTVGISVSGTATLNTDYSLSGSSFTISAGSTTGSVTVTPTDDSTFEGNETIIIDVSSVSGGSATENGTQQVTISLVEDDSGPALSINDVTTSDESASNATFTITSSVISASNMTVDWTTSNGTATAGSDYTAGSGTATITAGQTTTTINVGILADTLDETNETVTITLSNATLATISDSTGTLTITDDDTAPSISIANVSAAENASTATMTATIDAASGKDVTFDYATSDGTATAGSDYTAGSGSLTISAGQTTKTFTVPITDDTTDENNETVTVAISNAANTSNTTASATLTITDNDNPPSLSIADAQSTDESATSTTLTVSLSSASAKAITVDYATSDGTATAGSDYTATSGTLSFAAGETSKTIEVTPIQDNTFEGNETVTITISNPSNATISDATATFTITEDDTGPQLSINNVTVDEDAGSATFTVTMSPTSTSAVTVDYATSNVTATAGADYTATSGTLTFSAGDSSKTISVTVANDSLDEANETATVSLTNASGASTSNASGTLTITDDDATPSISINSSASVIEGDSGTSTQNMTVTLSAVSGRDVTFNYTITGGTASSADFTSDSGTLTISAGDTTSTIPVSIKGDTIEESRTSETVIVTISSPTNASLSGSGIGTVSIADNDGLNGGTTATYNSSDATAIPLRTDFSQSDFGSPTRASDYNPYENINLHKALAYESSGSNILGSGKVIAVMDSGFLVNNFGSNNATHQEFNGKTISAYNTSGFSTYNNSNNWHGTFVASIAAGNDTVGAMMGVAPEADLHLHDTGFTSGGSSTAWWKLGTDSAASVGAIVQNNSWGFDDSQGGWDGSQYNASVAINTYVNYMNSNSLTGAQTLEAFASQDNDSNGINDILYTETAAQWQEYINSLNTYQNTGVVVFALSNNWLFPDADVSAALPELFPELKEAWMTVANVNITGTGTQSFALESAPCKSTASYCLAADGTNILGAGGNDYTVGGYDYETSTGTSFAAPQVSGAVALLASHFPNQTPEMWVDRLLASANNNIGFTQTGSVTFGNGIVHGYSDEAGHGILDIYAALQPIYSDSAARGVYAGARNLNSGRFDLIRSGIQTSRSFGDGLSMGLSGLQSYFYDGLNGGFKYDISGHLSQIPETAETIDLKNEVSLIGSKKTFKIKSNDEVNYRGTATSLNNEMKTANLFTTVKAPAPTIQSFFNYGPSSLSSYIDYDMPYLSTNEGGVGITYSQNFGDTKYMISVNNPVELEAGEKTAGKQRVTSMLLDTKVTPSTNIGFLSGQAIEADAFLGLQGTEAFNLDNSISKTNFIGIKSNTFLDNDLKLTTMITSGSSDMSRNGDGIINGGKDVVSNSYGLSVEKLNIFNNDLLSLSIMQPNRVEKGSLNVITTNLSDSEGNLTYNNNDVSIVPSGRQKDFAISYAKIFDENLSISSKFVATQELNHVKDSKDVYSGFIGFKYNNLKAGMSGANHRKGLDAHFEYSIDF